MKKYFSIAIASLLMAAPLFLSSCGDDDPILDDNQEQVMTEWIEPYHEKNSTPDDVKTYMASSMKNHHLVNETHSAENVQLAYSTGDINVGVLYSFSTVTGALYSVIDTELTVNSSVVIEYLQDVISNFAPPKFRKIKQPENGKVKQPTKKTGVKLLQKKKYSLCLYCKSETNHEYFQQNQLHKETSNVVQS